MDSETRSAYLANKRKQLKDLLATDVNTSIPSSVLLNTSVASSIDTHIPVAPLLQKQQHRNTTETTTSPVDVRSRANPSPKTNEKLSSSSASSRTTNTGTNYHGQRFPTLAPSVAAKITAKQQQQQQHTLPLTSSINRSSPPPSTTIATTTTTSTKPLTYQEKLQLNARYSLHSSVNQQAILLANQKRQGSVVSSSSSGYPVGTSSSSSSSSSALRSSTSSVDGSTPSSSHETTVLHTSTVNNSIVTGTAAVPLLRSSSPVVVNGTIDTTEDEHGPLVLNTSITSLPVNISNVSSVSTQETQTVRRRQYDHEKRNGEGYENYDLDSTLHSVITVDDGEEDSEGKRADGADESSRTVSNDPPSRHQSHPPPPVAEGTVPHSYSPSSAIRTNPFTVNGKTKEYLDSPNFTVSPSPVKPLPSSFTNENTAPTNNKTNNDSSNVSLNHSFSNRITTTSEFISTVDNATHVAQRLFDTYPKEPSSDTAPPATSSSIPSVSSPSSQPSHPTKKLTVLPFTPNSMDDSSVVANFLKQLEEMDSQLGLSTVSTNLSSPPKPLNPTNTTSYPLFASTLPDPGTVIPNPSSSTDSSSSSSSLPSHPPESSITDSPTVSTFSSIRTKVVAMTMELDEKSKTIAILRGQLGTARKLLNDKETEYNQRQQQALEQQQKEFEVSITDKLVFIERLLADKSVLVGQVNELQETLTVTRTALQDQQTMYEQRLKLETERVRETVLQQERVRREAWMETTTKQIKERTLKGLEPDIQKLLDKHKEEITKIQLTCAEEIAASHERFRKEKDQAVQQALEQAEGTETDKVKQERLLWKQRENQLRDDYDKEIKQLREKYREEIDDERRRSAAIARTDASRQLDELNKVQMEWQNRLDDVLKRHALEKAQHVTEITEAVTAEAKKYIESREAWENRTVTKLKREFEEKERELRNENSRTRDEQLKLVVARMDTEHQEEKRQLVKEYEEKLLHQQKEYTQTIDKLKEEWRNRYEEMTASRDTILANQGDLTVKLSSTLDTTRNELGQYKIENEKLRQQCTNVTKEYEKYQQTSIVTQHSMESKYTQQIEQLQHLIEQLTNDKETITKESDDRFHHLQQHHRNEIQELQSRVNVAIRKRDDIITELKAKVDEERAKAEVAKRLMQETRNELGSL